MVLQNGCTGHKQAGANPPHPGFLCRGGRTGKSCNRLHVEVWINHSTNQSMAKLLFSISFVTFDVMAVGTGAWRAAGGFTIVPAAACCVVLLFTHVSCVSYWMQTKGWDGMGNQVRGFPP